jgi:hypothetical protein
MGRYSHRPAEVKERPYEIHPIWRGIGCIMLIIGPFIAFSAAHILVNLDMENGWMAVPREMRGAVTIDVLGLTIEHLYADLLVTAILLLLGFGLLMVVYAIIYGMAGPKRFGPMDSPPIRYGPPRPRSPKKKKKR